MDLFSVSEVPSSGEVPRTLAPGVIWDSEAESRFVEQVKDMVRNGLSGRGYPMADAVRSARWAVEADLHRKLIRREVEKADHTYEPADKRALMTRWEQDYGKSRADEIARIIRSDARKVVLETW